LAFLLFKKIACNYSLQESSISLLAVKLTQILDNEIEDVFAMK